MYFPITTPQQSDVADLIDYLKIVSFETDNLLLPPNMPDLSESSVATGIEPSNNTAALIVRDGDKIIAMAQLFRSIWPDTQHRATLVMSVRQSYSGQRIATSLMHNLEQTAKDMGLTQLELAVQANNLRAIVLYERVGFNPIGLYNNYYRDDRGEYSDAYLMTKPVF